MDGDTRMLITHLWWRQQGIKRATSQILKLHSDSTPLCHYATHSLIRHHCHKVGRNCTIVSERLYTAI